MWILGIMFGAAVLALTMRASERSVRGLVVLMVLMVVAFEALTSGLL